MSGIGFLGVIIVWAFWLWIIKKILDFDRMGKEMLRVLNEISQKLDRKE